MSNKDERIYRFKRKQDLSMTPFRGMKKELDEFLINTINKKERTYYLYDSYNDMKQEYCVDPKTIIGEVVEVTSEYITVKTTHNLDKYTDYYACAACICNRVTKGFSNLLLFYLSWI